MPQPRQRAIVSVTNDLVTDNRVHRTCMALVGLGYEVLLVGRVLPKSATLERPYRTKRMRLLFNKGPLFYAEYNLRLFFFLFFARGELLVANDLDTLLANYLARRGRKLVYDSHEFYTEVPELTARPAVRRIWLAIEKWIFPRLQNVITVNQSIADAYKERYGSDVHVVRNIPIKRKLADPPSRGSLGLPRDTTVLILQGAGINRDRGVEELIKAMVYLPECFLVLIGGGDLWSSLGGLAIHAGVEDRVRLIDRLPYERMMDYTRNADLGLTLDKDTNLNYRFSLPNKLFDYLNAGIPVLATDLPEVAAIVRKFDAGIVIPTADPASIAREVKAFFADEGHVLRTRANATFAARELDGQVEMDRLVAVLRNA
ncbi:MAG: glycosyltransferase [Flavobacteriales bacterium]|nr:glycosyltransferase [Flavobacteriales bacterium]